MTVFELKQDLCKKYIKEEKINIAKAFMGITKDCPVKTNTTVCYENKMVHKLSTSSIRLLPMTIVDKSPLLFYVNIVHDTGRSCFEGEYQFIKKN
jgi:hypothetical protein